ncbi:MAG: SdiA-regulated domain-containing protein [Kofleriaceae bacterium]
MTSLLLLLAGCTTREPIDIAPSQDDSKADGLAKHLKLQDDHRLHVDEPSDLAFADGRLYTVSDRHSNIYEIDDDGDVKDTIGVRGTDLEALAIDDKGRFFIGDESSGKIWRLHDNGDRDEEIELDDVDDGNSGIEGLAFDDDGHLFVAKEKDPARIYELDEDGEVVDVKRIDFADDLSALAFNPDDGHLYALSDEEHSLYRLDKDLRRKTTWRLPIAHPEGIAFDDDGSTVYIASDSEERLYVFELE